MGSLKQYLGKSGKNSIGFAKCLKEGEKQNAEQREKGILRKKLDKTQKSSEYTKIEREKQKGMRTS